MPQLDLLTHYPFEDMPAMEWYPPAATLDEGAEDPDELDIDNASGAMAE